MNGETVPNLFDLKSPTGRLKTYFDYTFKDHAFLRLGFQNAHWISDELVRTNQPWPHQLAHWKRQGIKTVINLRGGFDGSFYALEKEACARHGLELVNFTVASREVPTVAQVLGAKKLFDRIAYPALMHCKSGADRAGVMSVLYMHFRQGKTIREAVEQLGFRYLHVKQGKTGVLDYTFERYLAEGETAGLSFLEWVQTPAYDPKGMKATFQSEMWGRLLSDVLLRRE